MAKNKNDQTTPEEEAMEISDDSSATQSMQQAMEVTPSGPDFSHAVQADFIVVTAQPAAVAETMYRHSDDGYSQGSARMGENPLKNHHEEHNHQRGQNSNVMGPAVTSSEDQHSPPKQQETTQDAAKVYIRVEWQSKKTQKYIKDLEITLQSWASKTLSKDIGNKCSFINFKCLGDDEDQKTCVEVEIKPSAALDRLMKIKNTDLKIKGSSNNIKVEFLKNKPKYAEEIPESKEKQKSSVSEKSSGTDDAAVRDSAVANFKKNTENVMMEQQISTGPSVEAHPSLTMADGTEGAAKDVKSELTVPFYQFWYLTQVYSTELEEVLKTYGVHMDAEVSVRLTPKEISTNAPIDEAVQKFSDLVSEATKNLSSVEIPHSDLESDIMKNVQRNIPNKENRMVMRTSADNCQLFAPERFTSVVKNQLHRPEQSSRDYGASGSSTLHQTSKPINVSIRDPPAPLQINQTHWMIMNKVFQEQISNLESKYGVFFHCANFNGSIQVSAQPTGPHQHNLEAQALTALMKLHQKVVTSTVTCELDPSNREKVLHGLERIRSIYPYVGVGEHNGRWKLFGLPQHLVPAVYEIEKIMGPVFDAKTKSKLGSPSDFPERGAQPDQMSNAAEGRDSDFNPKGESSGLKRQSIRDKDLKEKEDEEDKCPICMDSFTDQKKLQCGHKFCKDCLEQSERALGKICSVCKKVYGTLTGNQPTGRMNVSYQRMSLPGFPHVGSIVIDYSIPSGTQTKEHPNPGRPYYGTHRTAYLPDNQEGNQILKLLQRAFDQKLIFTVGTSRTTGAEDSVIWNDIHHKTSSSGSYGYPDPDYLRRVREELKAKGIE